MLRLHQQVVDYQPSRAVPQAFPAHLAAAFSKWPYSTLLPDLEKPLKNPEQAHQKEPEGKSPQPEPVDVPTQSRHGMENGRSSEDSSADKHTSASPTPNTLTTHLQHSDPVVCSPAPMEVTAVLPTPDAAAIVTVKAVQGRLARLSEPAPHIHETVASDTRAELAGRGEARMTVEQGKEGGRSASEQRNNRKDDQERRPAPRTRSRSPSRPHRRTGGESAQREQPHSPSRGTDRQEKPRSKALQVESLKEERMERGRQREAERERERRSRGDRGDNARQSERERRSEIAGRYDREERRQEPSRTEREARGVEPSQAVPQAAKAGEGHNVANQNGLSLSGGVGRDAEPVASSFTEGRIVHCRLGMEREALAGLTFPSDEESDVTGLHDHMAVYLWDVAGQLLHGVYTGNSRAKVKCASTGRKPCFQVSVRHSIKCGSLKFADIEGVVEVERVTSKGLKLLSSRLGTSQAQQLCQLFQKRPHAP